MPAMATDLEQVSKMKLFLRALTGESVGVQCESCGIQEQVIPLPSFPGPGLGDDEPIAYTCEDCRDMGLEDAERHSS
jgi:hypothetical protein